MNKEFFKKIILGFLFLSIAFNVSYWAIAKYDVYSDLTAVGDAASYIEMSKGNWDVPSPYRYRIVVPAIVSVLNQYFHPEVFLSQYYEGVDSKRIQLNFGLVNILLIALTAYIFYFYCKELKFAEWECLVGVFLFFTSFFVVTYYPVPMVDAAGAFILMAAFYAILRKSALWVGLILLVGLFTKESALIIPVIVFLSERTILSARLLACIPGVCAYVFFRAMLPSAEGHSIFEILTNGALLQTSIQNGLNNLDLYTVIENVQTYMFLWVLFFVGLVKGLIPDFVRRQLILLLLPLIVPFAVHSSSVGRVAFYLFPLVIPVALLVLRDVLKENPDPQ